MMTIIKLFGYATLLAAVSAEGPGYCSWSQCIEGYDFRHQNTDTNTYQCHGSKAACEVGVCSIQNPGKWCGDDAGESVDESPDTERNSEDPCAVEGIDVCLSEDATTAGVSEECFVLGARIAGRFEACMNCDPIVVSAATVCPQCTVAVIGRVRACQRTGPAFDVKELLEGLMGALNGVDLDALSAVLNNLDLDTIIDSLISNGDVTGDAIDASFGDITRLLDVPEIASAFEDQNVDVVTLAAAAKAAAESSGTVAGSSALFFVLAAASAAATFFV